MCCGEQRGLIYLGPVFAEDELNEARVAPDGTVWAAKIAAACRCAQEVREFGPDPAVGN
jgi:uncharacterized protein CbrC (UPF0167 family)